MKKIILLTLLSTLFGTNIYAQSDNQPNNPELEITEDGKRLEATIACLDRLEAPTKYNAFAESFVSDPNFPKKSSNKTTEDLKKAVDQYFKNNPGLIDKVRSERKKAHDQLYGSRPY